MSNPPGKPRQVGQSEFGNMKSTMHINSEIFHPGSIISGFLKLECKESTFVRGIWVKLIGEVVMHYKTNFKQHTNAKISSNSMLNEIKIDIFEEYIRQRHIQLGCLTEICKLKRERMEARVEQPNRVNAEDVGNDPANMSGTVTTSSSTNASSASSPATKDEIELKKFTQQLQAVQSDYHNNALHQVLLGLGEECTRDEYGNSVSNHSNDLLVINSGVHLFPFSFQLPLETTLVTTNANDTSGKNDTDTMNVLCCIPPSYQDSNIQCSYRIVSVVDTPISLTPATEIVHYVQVGCNNPQAACSNANCTVDAQDSIFHNLYKQQQYQHRIYQVLHRMTCAKNRKSNGAYPGNCNRIVQNAHINMKKWKELMRKYIVNGTSHMLTNRNDLSTDASVDSLYSMPCNIVPRYMLIGFDFEATSDLISFEKNSISKMLVNGIKYKHYSVTKFAEENKIREIQKVNQTALGNSQSRIAKCHGESIYHKLLWNNRHCAPQTSNDPASKCINALRHITKSFLPSIFVKHGSNAGTTSVNTNNQNGTSCTGGTREVLRDITNATVVANEATTGAKKQLLGPQESWTQPALCPPPSEAAEPLIGFKKSDDKNWRPHVYVFGHTNTNLHPPSNAPASDHAVTYDDIIEFDIDLVNIDRLLEEKYQANAVAVGFNDNSGAAGGINSSNSNSVSISNYQRQAKLSNDSSYSYRQTTNPTVLCNSVYCSMPTILKLKEPVEAIQPLSATPKLGLIIHIKAQVWVRTTNSTPKAKSANLLDKSAATTNQGSFGLVKQHILNEFVIPLPDVSGVKDRTGEAPVADGDTTSDTAKKHHLLCQCKIPIVYDKSERVEALGEWPFPRCIDHRIKVNPKDPLDARRNHRRVVNYRGPSPVSAPRGRSEANRNDVVADDVTSSANNGATADSRFNVLTLGPDELPNTTIFSFTAQCSFYEYRHVVECNVIDINKMPKGMTHTWEHAIPNSYMATTPFEFLVLPPCASDSNPESNAVNAGNVGNEVTTSGDVQLPPGVPSFGTSAGIEDGANDLDNRNGQEYERSLTAIDVNCERSPNELERVDHQTGEQEEMESLLRATMDAANNIHHAAATEAVAASSGRAQFVPCTPPTKSNTRPKTRFNTAAVAKNSDDAAPTPPVPKTPTAKCLNKRPVIKVQGSVVSRGPAAVVVDRSRRYRSNNRSDADGQAVLVNSIITNDSTTLDQCDAPVAQAEVHPILRNLQQDNGEHDPTGQSLFDPNMLSRHTRNIIESVDISTINRSSRPTDIPRELNDVSTGDMLAVDQANAGRNGHANVRHARNNNIGGAGQTELAMVPAIAVHYPSTPYFSPLSNEYVRILTEQSRQERRCLELNLTGLNHGNSGAETEALHVEAITDSDVDSGVEDRYGLSNIQETPRLLTSRGLEMNSNFSDEEAQIETSSPINDSSSGTYDGSVNVNVVESRASSIGTSSDIENISTSSDTHTGGDICEGNANSNEALADTGDEGEMSDSLSADNTTTSNIDGVEVIVETVVAANESGAAPSNPINAADLANCSIKVATPLGTSRGTSNATVSNHHLSTSISSPAVFQYAVLPGHHAECNLIANFPMQVQFGFRESNANTDSEASSAQNGVSSNICNDGNEVMEFEAITDHVHSAPNELQTECEYESELAASTIAASTTPLRTSQSSDNFDLIATNNNGIQSQILELIDINQ